MTTGAWILLASLALVVAVGLWRAYADGRFTGTHAIAAAVVQLVEPPVQLVEPPGQLVEPRAQRASRDQPSPCSRQTSSVTARRCCSSAPPSARPAARPDGCWPTSPAVVPGVTHVEIDAEHHLDLVRRVGVLRTPTTLVLDARGGK